MYQICCCKVPILIVDLMFYNLYYYLLFYGLLWFILTQPVLKPLQLSFY